MNMEELYAAYFHDIFRFVFSLTKNQSLTEDIVQETFTRAYLHKDMFENRSNKAWLFTVARHLFYDHLRKNKRIANLEYDFSNIPDLVPSLEEQLLEKEDVQKIYKEICNLKANYREAMLCFYVEELSYKEAAEKMNVTESNFKSILFRAKRNLKRSLKRKGEFLE